MPSFHPSERLRFCPFCGGSRFVWDGVKSHRCADCGHKLYTNAAGAVIAVIENEKGEVLFVRRRFNPAKGTLDLPGGFIDLNERAEDAVVREVKEEVGLEVVETRFLTTFPNTYLYDTLLYHTIDLAFRCRVEDFSPLHAADDAEDCSFLSLQEVELSAIGLESIQRLVAGLKEGAFTSAGIF